MIKFAVESYYNVLLELRPMLEQHWAEISWYQDEVPYDPDWDRYAKMADAGMLHIVTARDEGKLIGYYISLLTAGMHYRSTVYAMNDVLFVDPEYRGGTVAYRMFKYAFEQLKAAGAQIITIHMKTDAPFEKLCQKLGMQKQEYLYSIYIGD